MALLTRRISGGTLNAWTVTGGTLATVLSDDSDATEVRNTTNTTSTMTLEIVDLALPALAIVNSVAVRFRGEGTIGTARNMQVRMRSGVSGQSVTLFNAEVVDLATFGTPAQSTAPGGAAWSQQELDALLVDFQTPAIGTRTDIQEVWVDITYNEAPTSTVTAPVDLATITTTDRPTTTADYADPENNPIERYHVKVVTQATSQAPGFDINTSESVYEVGPTIGSTTSLTIATPLPNGTYKVYWRFADAGSNGRFGEWDFNTFTILVESPAQPTLGSVLDQATASISATIGGRDNMLSANAASMETDSSAIAAYTNCTLTDTFGGAPHGTRQVRMTATAAGDMTAGVASTATHRRPVSPGRLYQASVTMLLVQTARSVHAGIRWLDGAGNEIGTDYGHDVMDGTQVTATVTEVAPAGAVYGVPVAKVVGAVANEHHDIDKFSIAPGNSVLWTRGGFVDTTGALTGTVAELQRSIDAGVTWQTVVGADGLALTNPYQEVTFDDYAAPRGVPIVYRTRVIGTDTGASFTGLWSATTAPVTLSTDGWWLKHPEHPEWNTLLDVAPTFRIAIREPQETIPVLGAEEPLHATDGIKGLDLTLPLWSKDAAMFAAVWRLVTTGDVLLLQSNLGQQWWVKVQTGASFDRLLAVDPTGTFQTRHFHSATVPLVTARAPA